MSTKIPYVCKGQKLPSRVESIANVTSSSNYSKEILLHSQHKFHLTNRKEEKKGLPSPHEIQRL